MVYDVYWRVNDGRQGYPNIVAELDWSSIFCRSYEEAIRAHAKMRGVRKIVSISATNSKGKIRGRSYRDFLVSYPNKAVTEDKALYIGDELVSKIIRVFGSYSGKSACL